VAASYVLVLFDGLGVAQLEHDRARSLRETMAGELEAPFPSTTTVSLATVATATPASQHGQVSHLSWFPDLEKVVNTLKWVDLTGDSVAYDYPRLLPQPNLWERLRRAGIEPITVQPGDFAATPLTRALYRGARFEGVWTVDELVRATVDLASVPGRLVFTYLNFVDVAGHVFGLASDELTEAMGHVANAWDGILAGLPPDVAVIGTADHGLLEFSETDKIILREPHFDSLRMAGDTRGVQMWGDPKLMEEMADATGGELADPLALIGPDPTGTARSRLGEKVLLASDDTVIIPKGFDKRLRCYHGGLHPDEVRIPLLVG
jgi:hypothetical protein